MYRPESHEIDEAATRHFVSSLPTAWTHNEHKQDYGKDYLIEIGNNGKMTGTSCYVQQKGRNRVPTNEKAKYAQLRLEEKHALYYLDKVTDLPVFLVLVDVRANRGWWLFLQPYLRNDQSWRKKKSVLIRIPLANRLEDTAAFAAAIEQANRTMRGMHPTAISDSVRFAKEDAERRDPRFNVSVKVKNGMVTHVLNAKEPVTISFSIKSETLEESQRKWDELERGRPVSFKAGELIFEGSPLLTRSTTEDVIFKTRLRSASSVTVITVDSNGLPLGEIRDINGKLTGGRKEVTFKGCIGDELFTISIGPYGDLPKGTRRHFKSNCRVHEWEKVRISKLQWFDKLAPFLTTLESAEKLKLVFSKDGNFVMEEFVPIRGIVPKGFSGYFSAIKVIRELCKHFGIDPVWTMKGFSKLEYGTLKQLHSIFIGNRLEISTPKQNGTWALNRDIAQKHLERNGDFALAQHTEWKVNVLRSKIVANVDRTLTFLEMEILGDLKDGNAEVKFTVTDRTKTTLTPTKEDDGDGQSYVA